VEPLTARWRLPDHPLVRAAVVSVASSLVYAAAAAIASLAYQLVAPAVYDDTTRHGLMALKTLFYACFAFQLLLSALGAVFLIRHYRPPLQVILPTLALLLAVFVYLTLLLAASFNACEMNVSFPLGGRSC
jgi:hypothetical protein